MVVASRVRQGKRDEKRGSQYGDKEREGNVLNIFFWCNSVLNFLVREKW